MRFISLYLLILFLISNAWGYYKSDVQSEKEIILLELQLQSRISQAVRVAFSDLNFHASVAVKLDDNKTVVEKNLENNELDYLPLVIRDQVNSERNTLTIESYQIRIVSPTLFSKETKNQIKELIDGELRGKKYGLKFVQIGNTGFILGVKKGLKIVFIDNFANWLLVILSVTMVFFGYQFYTKRTFINKSQIHNVHKSNVDELVKFIRSGIEKNREILKQIVKDDSAELKGIKSLMPYLQIQFTADEIFNKTTLIRLEQESGFYTEAEFDLWLKEFAERISAKLLKEGNGPSIKRASDEIVAQLVNIHVEILAKTLKEIDDVSTYGVTFHYLSEEIVRELTPYFDRPIWSDITPSDLHELNHEHILNNVINKSRKLVNIESGSSPETENGPTENKGSTEDMIASVFASQGKNLKGSNDQTEDSLNMFAFGSTIEVKKEENTTMSGGNPADDMINSILKQHGKIRDENNSADSDNVGPLVTKNEWNKDSIMKLPGSYLKSKFEVRSAEEIALLLHSLPKSIRYFIISYMDQDKLNEANLILDQITDEVKSQKALESFLSEVKSDHNEGLFQIDEKKAA